jgi:hypothetical protein
LIWAKNSQGYIYWFTDDEWKALGPNSGWVALTRGEMSYWVGNDHYRLNPNGPNPNADPRDFYSWAGWRRIGGEGVNMMEEQFASAGIGAVGGRIMVAMSAKILGGLLGDIPITLGLSGAGTAGGETAGGVAGGIVGESTVVIPKGGYAPPEPLPMQTVGGVDIPTSLPGAVGLHTTLGTRIGSDGVLYRQSATFSESVFSGNAPKANGLPVSLSRVDWHNHSRPWDHTNPHQHAFTPTQTGGGKVVWAKGNQVPFAVKR